MEDDFEFISLAALTANVLQWLKLSEHHQKYRQGQTCQKRDEEHRSEENGDAVESRLSDGAAM